MSDGYIIINSIGGAMSYNVVGLSNDEAHSLCGIASNDMYRRLAMEVAVIKDLEKGDKPDGGTNGRKSDSNPDNNKPDTVEKVVSEQDSVDGSDRGSGGDSGVCNEPPF